MRNKTIIIAEAGVNHNGNLLIAKKLIDAASKAGADIVKFQTFNASKIVTLKAQKANYQIEKKFKNETQFEMLKKLELSFNDYKVLKNHCKKRNIEFLSSPFDIESAKFLISIQVKRIKIASGEITNYPLLKFIAKKNKKTILSTGMSSIKEIQESVSVLYKNGLSKKNLTLLHCTSSYPADYNEVHLKAISLMKKKFKINIGYSDHTKGIDVPIAAVAIGATLLEKHFTLNRKMKGPDHLSSLEPDEFTRMVKSIRIIEKSLGDEKKILNKKEKNNKKIIRKSIYASKNIKIGEYFTERNLTTKRPAAGVSPMKWNKFINKKSKKNYKVDDLIR